MQTAQEGTGPHRALGGNHGQPRDCSFPWSQARVHGFWPAGRPGLRVPQACIWKTTNSAVRGSAGTQAQRQAPGGPLSHRACLQNPTADTPMPHPLLLLFIFIFSFFFLFFEVGKEVLKRTSEVFSKYQGRPRLEIGLVREGPALV